ncbi:MAG: hypothetical protein CH6_0103 [Candidatus Kapaibacterium sp.]|nr:MAG: hypothetical protein CH6_0103 [Candidatus Kapabacteria bacterium]
MNQGPELKEKLALIEQANVLREKYFSLLDYKAVVFQEKENSATIHPNNILPSLNHILLRTFQYRIYTQSEAIILYNKLLEALLDFQKHISDAVLEKLNKLQIKFVEIESKEEK